MALFVVRHQHAAEHCPAQDPYMGAMLLNHLKHTLYFIVEAEDEGRLREFMQPFQMAGSLDIYPASTCARGMAAEPEPELARAPRPAVAIADRDP